MLGLAALDSFTMFLSFTNLSKIIFGDVVAIALAGIAGGVIFE